MSMTDPQQARDFEPAGVDFDDSPGAKGGKGRPEGHPLVTVWTRPRATMRRILETDPTYLVIPLARAWGVSRAFDRAARRNLGDKTPTPGLLGMILVFGPAGGIFGLYVFGWLWSWAGRKLGGEGDAAAVRAAITWGQTPALLANAIQLALLGAIGSELFATATPNLFASPGLRGFYLGGLVALLTLGAWTFILSLKCVGEAHRFSAWRALGAIILGSFVFLFLGLILMGGPPSSSSS